MSLARETTVSQRGGTNATFLNNPSDDTPSGLFLDFDLMRRAFSFFRQRSAGASL